MASTARHPDTAEKKLTIGQASAASGVHAKMIRHYESAGIVPKARRSQADYRLYSADDLHVLRFIKRARDLGFSMKEIKTLLSLWRNRNRSSADVKAMTLAHIAELERKIEQLRSMSEALQNLAHCCHGDDRPTCPILESLAGP